MLSTKRGPNYISAQIPETNLRSSDEDVFVSGQLSDLNLQLIQEQRLRLGLEERVRTLEAQLATATTTTASTTPTTGSTIIKRLPVRLYTIVLWLKTVFCR